MSANMSVDELIEWLKKEGFKDPATLDKLKDQEYDSEAFCELTEKELEDFNPSLKEGPFKKLRKCWRKLRQPTHEKEASPKPPVTPPDSPPPKKKPAPSQQPGKTQSGKNSQEYNAVKSNITSITDALRVQPAALQSMRQKFVQEDWLQPGHKPNEDELVDSVLNRIEGKASEFWVFIAILRDIVGLNLIVDKLVAAVQPQPSSPPVTTTGTSVAQPQPQPMTHPVYGEKPTMPKLSLLEWKKDGSPNELRLVEETARNWRNLGSAGLGMGESLLNNLEDRLDNVNSCRKVLQRFLENGSPKYKTPTWGNLIEALTRAQMGVVASTLQEALLYAPQ